LPIFGSKQTYGRKKIPYYWHNGPDCRMNLALFFFLKNFQKFLKFFADLKSQTQKKEKNPFFQFLKKKITNWRKFAQKHF
jgi:hypothetical protein